MSPFLFSHLTISISCNLPKGCHWFQVVHKLRWELKPFLKQRQKPGHHWQGHDYVSPSLSLSLSDMASVPIETDTSPFISSLSLSGSEDTLGKKLLLKLSQSFSLTHTHRHTHLSFYDCEVPCCHNALTSPSAPTLTITTKYLTPT